MSAAWVVEIVLAILVPLAQAMQPSNHLSTVDCRRQIDAALEAAAPTHVGGSRQTLDLKATLGSREYREAYRAGVTLLSQPEMAYGTSLAEVVAVLGHPDLMFANATDGVQVYYNTNGGPLDLSFQACGLIHKAMDTPAHWRGTDAELATLWSKARRSKEWWLWQPMTGTLSRVEGPADRGNGPGLEVDLGGGIFGETGRLSFVLASSVTCRGQWSASAGNAV